MKFNPEIHHRRSIRLPKYSYAQAGAYFITLCTYKKQNLFGDIKENKMHLNQIGKVVKEEWLKSVTIRKEIALDEWIIMPNHLHGIVIIKVNGSLGARLVPLPPLPFMRRKPRSLSSFVAGVKSAVTKF
ncbi:MAG: hypothetical protein Tsb0014_05040 [Pleurocapsa sp.]